MDVETTHLRYNKGNVVSGVVPNVAIFILNDNNKV